MAETNRNGLRKTIVVNRPLKVGEEVVVVSTQAVKGEPVRFVKQVSPSMTQFVANGICAGDVEPLETPTTQAYPENPNSKNRTANVFRNFKRFVVKE